MKFWKKKTTRYNLITINLFLGISEERSTISRTQSQKSLSQDFIFELFTLSTAAGTWGLTEPAGFNDETRWAFTRWPWSLLVNRWPNRSALTKTKRRSLPLFHLLLLIFPRGEGLTKVKQRVSLHWKYQWKSSIFYFRMHVWHLVSCVLNLHLISQMKSVLCS